MKLRFTPRAAQDLAAIADYIRARNPAAAQRVRAAILHSLQNLVLFPRVGRAQTVEGVRKLVTRKYPYLVYYTVDETGEEIIILTIQHPTRESMRMPNLFRGGRLCLLNDLHPYLPRKAEKPIFQSGRSTTSPSVSKSCADCFFDGS
jgi:plasmid stabilization system protein ParE